MRSNLRSFPQPWQTTKNLMDHVELFEKIVSITRSNRVPMDYLKCQVFLFFVRDKAHCWVFLRNKIQGFQKGLVESFSEAWEWFKDSKCDCPHHYFIGANLLSTFYEGLHSNYKLSLYIQQWRFHNKDCCKRTFSYRQSRCKQHQQFFDYDRTTRSINSDYKLCSSIDSDFKQITEFKNMMNLILKNQQHSVSAFEVVFDADVELYQDFDADGSNDQDEEVNYIGTQRFYQNHTTTT